MYVYGNWTDPIAITVRIEFDHDGDGVIEATAITDSDGRFTYQPAGLKLGSVTIRARTMDDDVDPPVVGNWKSVSFVYSSDPDAAEAQDLAAAYAQFDADWQAAEDNYDSALSAAGLYLSHRLPSLV